MKGAGSFMVREKIEKDDLDSGPLCVFCKELPSFFLLRSPLGD